MLFLDSMVAKRSGRHSWDAEKAVEMLSSRGHRLVELLLPDGQGKLYLDRDVYVGIHPPTPQTVALHTELVESKVQEILDRLRTDTNSLSAVIATRHGFCAKRSRFKLSFRPFLQGMRIRRTDIPKVLSWVGQEGFWDMGVYKQNEQLLAAVNGCKGQGDTRVLLPVDADLLQYVAQHTDPSWPFLDLPADYSVPEPRQHQDTPDLQFIHNLLACLSSDTADDRKKWIRVGMVLKRHGTETGEQSRYFAEWVIFSRRGSKFSGEPDCRRTWASLHPAGACTLGTLCYMAREDDECAFVRASLEKVTRQKR